MASPAKFPTTLVPGFNQTISFKDSDDLSVQLTALAEKVAHVYAGYLTPEGHKQRGEDFAFQDYPTSFPKKETVELFEKALAKKIVSSVLAGLEDERRSVAKLTTDYAPEGMLSDVLNQSGIDFRTALQFSRFFPWKSSCAITVNQETREITFKMGGGLLAYITSK
ncbi:MAG: hypothetical protein K1X28_01025 [Parachlamydiales bacterium]|nr:hypothetical protein [Parachlamydiales bacterium]